jgi:hypothetical protein
MLFNSITRAEPYLPLHILFIKDTGVAWLSKVHVMRFLVNSGNERNPREQSEIVLTFTKSLGI